MEKRSSEGNQRREDQLKLVVQTLKLPMVELGVKSGAGVLNNDQPSLFPILAVRFMLLLLGYYSLSPFTNVGSCSECMCVFTYLF